MKCSIKQINCENIAIFFKKQPLKAVAFLRLYAIIIKQLMRNKKQNETPTENKKNLKFFDRYMRA